MTTAINTTIEVEALLFVVTAGVIFITSIKTTSSSSKTIPLIAVTTEGTEGVSFGSRTVDPIVAVSLNTKYFTMYNENLLLDLFTSFLKNARLG